MAPNTVDKAIEYTLVKDTRITELERAMVALETNQERVWDLVLMSGVVLSAVIFALALVILKVRANTRDIGVGRRSVDALEQRVNTIAEELTASVADLRSAIGQVEAIGEHAAQAAARHMQAALEDLDIQIQAIMRGVTAVAHGGRLAQG